MGKLSNHDAVAALRHATRHLAPSEARYVSAKFWSSVAQRKQTRHAWAGLSLLTAGLVALIVAAGCLGEPAKAPCDEATYARIMVQCTAAVAAQCPPGDAPCLVEDDCDRQLRARRDTCLGTSK